ncbi:MAG: class I SAM-dependent methyltransferase [Planctomycetaceae bacterium]
MSPPAQVNYRQITDCTESYFDRLGDSPLGMGWPNAADAVKRYDVMLDIIRPDHTSRVSLLDFGCGAGHLLEHITAQGRTDIEYHGIDLSQRFIDSCRRKHPTADFHCGDILEHPELLPDFDYAVINGVFTSKCGMNFDEMFSFVQRVIALLFRRSRVGIAFNAMSKQVDWERDDLFHLPLDRMAEFVCRELSRHFIIRNDYGLYEYTTYVYREASDQPPKSS